MIRLDKNVNWLLTPQTTSPKAELINFLMSEDRASRDTANRALNEKFGGGIPYDPDGDADGWRKAAQAWMANGR